MGDFTFVGKVSDIKPGTCSLAEVNGDRILLSNIDGSIHAIGELCPHADGPLSEGTMQGEKIECPWHASFFNLKTGEVTDGPSVEGVPAYELKIEGDNILVRL